MASYGNAVVSLNSDCEAVRCDRGQQTHLTVTSGFRMARSGMRCLSMECNTMATTPSEPSESDAQSPPRVPLLGPLAMGFAVSLLIAVVDVSAAALYAVMSGAIVAVAWLIWLIPRSLVKKPLRCPRVALLASLIVRAWRAVVFATLFVAFVLVVQLTRPSRDPAMRSDCARNLRVIGEAMRQYHAAYGCFPPAFRADKMGRPMHSWRVLILPYVDDADAVAVYTQYRFDEPWSSQHNRQVTVKAPAVFRCPADQSENAAKADYVMITGALGFSTGADSLCDEELLAIASERIAVAEAAHLDIHWAEPRDLRIEEMSLQVNAPEVPAIGSYHRFGANVLLCNGAVELLLDSAPAEQVKAMVMVRQRKSSRVGKVK